MVQVLKRSILLFSYVLQNPRGLCIDYERICGVVLGIVQSFPHLSVRLVAMNCLGIVLKFSTKQYICDENHEALKHRNLELKTLLERYSDPDCSSIDDRLACAKLLGAFACSEVRQMKLSLLVSNSEPSSSITCAAQIHSCGIYKCKESTAELTV